MNERETMQKSDGAIPVLKRTEPSGILQRKCGSCGNHTIAGGECPQCMKEKNGPPHEAQATPVTTLLQRAAAEPSNPLNEPLRSSIEQGLSHDFTRVRVHSGPASDEAAERIGARAYTLGNDIHLGAEARGLSGREYDHLLSHEAVHTVQQGGRSVSPHAGLTVSSPSDAAEHEAERIADSLTSQNAGQGPSRSLALRDSVRANSGRQTVARMVGPQLQRDLTGKHAVKDGAFELNLITQSNPGAKSGMMGTIKFTASETAPDSSNIRMLQIARTEIVDTGKDHVYTGGEANRNKIKTNTATGVTPGYFVDVLHAGRNPRTNKADAAVSPYYIDDYGSGGGNLDGSKRGKTITPASLADFPGAAGANVRFSFETAAKADTGYVYATLTWGFTLSDAAKGTVEKEHAAAHRSPSKTFGAAVKAFDEFYKNPGSSTAP